MNHFLSVFCFFLFPWYLPRTEHDLKVVGFLYFFCKLIYDVFCIPEVTVLSIYKVIFDLQSQGWYVSIS